MTPWIQVYANLPSHRKVCRLRQELGFKTNYEAVGLLVSLWCWAAVNAPDGNLTGYASCDISEAIGYKKSPGKLLGVLEVTGFLDQREDGGHQIHDWDEHAALLMDSLEQQKKNTRERVRRYRDKRKQECNTGDAVTGNATCNACNGPTLPYLTLPNLTNNNSGGGDNAPARASEQELKEIGLEPGEFPAVTRERVEQVKQLTERLLRRYWAQNPGAWDYRHTFLLTPAPQSEGLLEYAFEAATVAGKAGDWRYIGGIMRRMTMRGITTAEEAREWDESRPDMEEE